MNFEFKIDRLCTIWVSESHFIKAETYEQAREIMVENFRLSANDNTFIGQNIQHDTLDDFPIEKNGGWPTAVLINHEGDEIADNTIKQTT